MFIRKRKIKMSKSKLLSTIKTILIKKSYRFILLSVLLLVCITCYLSEHLESGTGGKYICTGCNFKGEFHFGGGFDGGDYTYGYCYKCKEFSRINQESKETIINRILNRLKNLSKEEQITYKYDIEEIKKRIKKIEQENRGEIKCPHCGQTIKYYSCENCNSIIILFDFGKEICPRCEKNTFKKTEQRIYWD